MPLVFKPHRRKKTTSRFGNSSETVFDANAPAPTSEAERFFRAFGIRVRHTGNQVLGDCPFCGKERHLYAHHHKVLWHCKVCEESGNRVTFARQFVDQVAGAAALETYEPLSSNRGISVDDLRRSGIVQNPLNGEWLIPARNQAGEVVTLIRWKPGRRALQLTGLNTALLGLDELATEGPIYVAEGVWDWIVLKHLLESNEVSGSAIGAPGANSFKEEWVAAACRQQAQCLKNGLRTGQASAAGIINENRRSAGREPIRSGDSDAGRSVSIE